MFTLGLFRASAVCAALLISNLVCAAELHLPREERDSAWFAPKLVTNNRPMCAAALEAERDTFFNITDQEPPIAGLTSITTDDEVIEDPDVTVVAEYPRELALTLPDRSQAYLYFFGYPGCGGACESASVRIDRQRIVDSQDHWSRRSLQLPHDVPRTHRYGPDTWRVFKSSDGDFYLRGKLEYHTQWYRVAAADRWELACDIALKPDTGVADAKVLDAIGSLRLAADRIAGIPGDCGTMGTPRRWQQYRAEGLEAALYRPWAMVEQHADYESENSGGDYERIIVQMELWSLGGVMEHRAFAEYQAQFARAVATLAEFYRAQFKWEPARAAEMADAALKGAISSSFGFYVYEPYPGVGEQQLRRAILTRAPLDQIRALEVDVKTIDRPDQDSILNVAIEYPEALSYLLERGFNPNIGNGFGKTPLMYAAQYNQVAAAEILLKAGADPNAPTYVPPDRCEFQINTQSLTPLHYAARYSSARLIQLLLEQGAVTFIQSKGDNGAEYPLDRLQRYAGIGVKDERNPHIAEFEVAALAQLLTPLSESSKAAMAGELVARARSEYARGNAEKAYQHLRLALVAQPNLPDAIADLPLVALRAGHIGPAISAADRAVKTLGSPAALAASWFNKGLICEHPHAPTTFTPDRARCEWDTVEPFVNAWRVQPSPARANKLRTLIRESAASCAVADGGRHYKVALKDIHQSFRIYVLHRASETLDLSQIRWPSESVAVGAKAIEGFNLGSDAVTVLEAPVRRSGDYPRKMKLLIEGQECTPTLWKSPDL